VDLIGQGSYKQARELLEPLVESLPDLSEVHFVLGLTYHGEDCAQQARAYFQRALSLDPDNDLYLLYSSLSLYKLGELESSRAALVDYLTRNPRDSNALFVVGLIDFDRDEMESARLHMARAVEGSPTAKKEAEARKHLADVLIRQGALDEARDQLQRSIELNGEDDRAYHRLGRVLQRLGDIEGAARAREKMRSLQAGVAAVNVPHNPVGENPSFLPRAAEDHRP
jgi:tetratricopeptide (TPR) repeat protein